MYNITRIKLTEFQRQTLAYLLFEATHEQSLLTSINGNDIWVAMLTRFSPDEIEALKQVGKKVEQKAKLTNLVKH